MSFKEWEYIDASVYCRKVTDGTHDSPKSQAKGKPLITSKHIKGRSIDFETAYLISIDDFNKINQRSKVHQWDVLISMIGEYCGYCYVERNEEIDYAVKNVGIFKTGSKLKAEWIYYYLTSSEGKATLASLKSGTSQPYISLGALRSLKILFPKDELEAEQITSILSSLDEKIELNRQINQTLDAITQTIFSELCVPKGGELPEGWEERTFEEEFDAERGLSYKGAGLAESEGVPMHNLNSIYEGGGFKTEGVKYYTGAYKEKNVVKPGDVIVANTEQGHKYRLIGFPAIVPKFFGDLGIYSHHIYRLTPKRSSYLTPDFAYHLLLRNEVREQVIGFANGTTVNMLKVEGLKKPTFRMPPKDIVEKFTAIAKANRLLAEANIEENQTLTALRDSLLPKLMKGEIEVSAIQHEVLTN